MSPTKKKKDGKSAGVEIDPTPFGIMFSLLGPWGCSIILFYFFLYGLLPLASHCQYFCLPICFFATEYPWTSVSHGGVPPHIGDDVPPEWCAFRGNPPMSDGSPRGFCLSWGGKVPPHERRKPLGTRNFYVGNIENDIFCTGRIWGRYFQLGKSPCGRARTHSLFLIHRRS